MCHPASCRFMRVDSLNTLITFSISRISILQVILRFFCSRIFLPFTPFFSPRTSPPCLVSRFVTIYRGPSHTYKVQRLTESSSYNFRIQAISDAGEGPFSDTHTFCTTKSVPPTLKGKQRDLPPPTSLHGAESVQCHFHVCPDFFQFTC